MIDPTLADTIRKAFLQGTLSVETVLEDGSVRWLPISDVLRHHVPQKRSISILVEGAEVLATEDHSLFLVTEEGTIKEVPTSSIKVGDPLACVVEGQLRAKPVKAVVQAVTPIAMYDLSVPGPENFVLANGIVAHNSYSIGGISLDINKSSQYESLKQNAEGQADKAAEAKAATVKIIRGLQQSRYGMGVRSAFGPAVGRGILSPRSFV